MQQLTMIWQLLTASCLTLLPWQVSAAPLTPPHFVGDVTQRYLMQYGYLPMSDMEMGNLRTDTELTEAVRRLQTFGHVPVTGVVDAATRELMGRPRCALPDILPEEAIRHQQRGRQKRFIKQGSTWADQHLTWGIISYPERLSGRIVERDIRLATELWAQPSRLHFSQVTERPGSADIVVQFNRGYHGDGYPFDGAGRTLAHAFYPGTGIGGDIHFDADEHWIEHRNSGNTTYEEISLFLTAAHEMGHALGLYHSQVQNSIMSPYLFSSNSDTFVLPPDDVAGIQDLYGVNENYDMEESSSSDEEESTSIRTSTPATTVAAPAPIDDPSTPSSTIIPDPCDTSYDAISVIRRGIYVFKGKYFWRVDDRTMILEPVELSRFWYCLPSNLTRIDAVYERHAQDAIVFFSGRQYYVCRGNDELIESGPLKRLGLPDSLEKLDGAFVWGHNSRTYFMADTMYWRFDESVKHIELDYPRDMSMWKGVPYGSIDSAFKYNSTTYFFKGKMFYEFDDLRMKVRRNPMLSAPFWMGCPDNVERKNSPYISSGAASYNIHPATLPQVTQRLLVTCVIVILSAISIIN